LIKYPADILRDIFDFSKYSYFPVTFFNKKVLYR